MAEVKQQIPESEVDALTMLLDQLPIYATKIGYRTDSTEQERAFADACFKVHETWLDVKPR